MCVCACEGALPLLRRGRYPQWCVGQRRQSHPAPRRGRCRRCFPDRGRASSHQAVWRGWTGCRWQRCPDPAAPSGTLGQSNAFWDKMAWDCHWDSKYLCEGVTLLGGAFSLAGRVAECKNDWALVERGHVSDDPLGEGSGYSSHTWDREQSICSEWELGLFILWLHPIHFPPLYCATQRWKFKFCFIF